jgi:preprotein translocase subunit SecA
MVQVSTGEGKSVILGILSTYLALVGFKVYEACYSQYLSGRDYDDFRSLFVCLNIQDRIQYNIFS